MNKRKKILFENEAVVGIVAAFLIIGLVVTIISVIQTVYIPQIMKQTEADHMEMVADQFSQLKFAIDTQSALKVTGNPITTSVTLGNKELPFLLSSRAYGTLEIIKDGFTMTVTNQSFVVGTIRYSSTNSYFLNQEYFFETGAVIIRQYEGSTMVIKPAFYVSNQKNITTLTFTLINVTTVGEKNIIGGYGTYPIQLEYSKNYSTKIFRDISSIAIKTECPLAWMSFLNTSLMNHGVKNGELKLYSFEKIDGGFLLKFTNEKVVDLILKINDIEAQIAPGWIENFKNG